jgi:hypothetical protein
MGYAHIRGFAERSGSSWHNPIEAAAIARWVGENEQMLLDRYGAGKASIGEVLAVITPYAAQKRLVEQELKKRVGEQAKSVTVGTVHTLQGAERPVIIFSPTVTADPSSASPYYDHEPNLLNVAVSRARRSFLFFGDMRLCDSVQRRSPLRLLGDRLRKHETNQTKGVNPFEGEPEVQRLVNAREHDAFLANKMSKAHRRVILSSFRAWDEAIKDAGIDRLAKACAERKVKVSFVIGVRKHDDLRALEPALSLLASSGAVVLTSDKLHTKTLIIDDDIIVEGSFNCCNAHRKGEGNEERSFALSGGRARRYVEEAAAEFRALKKKRFEASAACGFRSGKVGERLGKPPADEGRASL